MSSAAVFWIRDGVIVDRMHLNPVAFAFAALQFGDLSAITSRGSEAYDTLMTELINFGFAQSGVSCAEKMRRFNEERFPLVTDVASAANYYNVLATEAASRCQYFDGACELLAELKAAGTLNFITSAVEQSVLDAWSDTNFGRRSAMHLTEILGSRPDFQKGRAHFQYVREKYRVERLVYVADAVAEIADGARLSLEEKIEPVGFAHVITADKVTLAHDFVCDAYKRISPQGHLKGSPDLIPERLQLTGETALMEELAHAGARKIVSGSSKSIMANLRQAFSDMELLPLN